MKNELTIWKYDKYLNSRKALLIILIIGFLFRIVPYTSNRSLWLDEASISLNIIQKSYAELLQPLDMDQGAPPGFLWVEKFFTQLFGENEFALRLFPLLAGLLSVYLFYLLARRVLPKEVLGMGLFLLAISTTSIYFASEVKQYSSDVMFCLLLILLAVRQKDSAFDVKNFVVFLSAGFVAILFSHPSVFVLAAIGTTMMVSALLKKQTREFWFYFFLSGICLLFFVALYYFIYRHLESNPFLMKFWGEAFMPFPPKNRGDLKWFFITYQQIFKNPMGYTLGGVAGLLFIAGAIRFWKTDRQ